MCVRDTIDLEPISCTSMQAGASFKVSQIAANDITLKDSSGRVGKIRHIGFMAVENSSQYLLCGKPPLAEFGYASGKPHIELRVLGLRFASTLPHKLRDDPSGLFLYAAEHAELLTPPDTSSTRTIRLQVPAL